MSKYIIEIKPEYEDKFRGVMILGAENSNLYVDSNTVDELEELNSDYINEHFSDLQDTAYQKGFEKGKDVRIKGCEGCMYQDTTIEHNPCNLCCNAFLNRWTAKADKIEVRDEVVWTEDENVVIVVTSIYTTDNMEWCDGFCKDGKVYSILTENARKTGRHFDIASILEAMKHD